MTKLLLSITEAADALSIGRTKLYDLIARGDIRVVKVDARTLVPVDALREYADQLAAT